MICPLPAREPITSSNDDTTNECLMYQCAWWDNNNGACSILSLAEVFDKIIGMLVKFQERQ